MNLLSKVCAGFEWLRSATFDAGAQGLGLDANHDKIPVPEDSFYLTDSFYSRLTPASVRAVADLARVISDGDLVAMYIYSNENEGLQLTEPLPQISVIDQKVWVKCFGEAALKAQGLTFKDDHSIKSNNCLMGRLGSFINIPVEGNAGFTLITIPCGLTLKKLIQLAANPLSAHTPVKVDPNAFHIKQYEDLLVEEGVMLISNGILAGSQTWSGTLYEGPNYTEVTKPKEPNPTEVTKLFLDLSSKAINNGGQRKRVVLALEKRAKHAKEQDDLAEKYRCRMPRIIEVFALCLLTYINSSDNTKKNRVRLLKDNRFDDFLKPIVLTVPYRNLETRCIDQPLGSGKANSDEANSDEANSDEANSDEANSDEDNSDEYKMRVGSFGADGPILSHGSVVSGYTGFLAVWECSSGHLPLNHCGLENATDEAGKK